MCVCVCWGGDAEFDSTFSSLLIPFIPALGDRLEVRLEEKGRSHTPSHSLPPHIHTTRIIPSAPLRASQLTETLRLSAQP